VQLVVSSLVLFFTSKPGQALFFIVLIVAAFLNELAYLPLGFYHKAMEKKRVARVPERTPRMSVVIPAHNEEKTIEATVLSVLESNYPNFEVIVVNDGSTDATEQVLLPYASAGKIVLLSRLQGGKAAAVNTGILAATGEIIVVIDADVLIERDVISKLAVHFDDPTVAAVSGNIKVGNRVNILTKIQALEYVRDLSLRRRAFDILDTMPVIPGATGAFRKAALERVGGMDRDTVVEDMDLTLRIVKAAEDVRFEGNARSYTEAPENLGAWIRQRRRWYGGTLQAFLKHREKWWRFGPLSVIGFPWLVMSMFFIPFIELTSLTLLFLYMYEQLFWGVFLASISFLVVEFSLSAMAVFVDGEDRKLILYTPFYVFFYRFLADIVRLRSYAEVLMGRAGWHRTGRYGGLPEKVRL